MTRWNAKQYDDTRLQPPSKLIEITTRLTGHQKPDLVVDLGCGTGLSTRAWLGFATQIIGIDPSPEMLSVARSRNDSSDASFIQGTGDHTGLSGNNADIVTCASAIHWMEPATTVDEVCRLLKPDGLFAILSYHWPPLSGFLELDHEFFKVNAKSRELVREMRIGSENNFFLKPVDFAQYVRDRNAFKYYREFFLSETLSLTGEQFVELACSLGQIQLLLKHGVSPDDFYLSRMTDLAADLLGSQASEMLVSWRAIIFKSVCDENN